MSGSMATSDEARDNIADLPIILEDLLSRIEAQAATHGDPAVVADLWAQVEFLQVR